LRGRTDVVIPDPSQPWTTGTHLERHPGPTPEEIKETLPPSVTVSGGDVVRVLDPAVGGVNFFNGFGPPFFGPSGNVAGVSNIFPLDGISGYIGTARRARRCVSQRRDSQQRPASGNARLQRGRGWEPVRHRSLLC
jgi:hypothetical protein